MQATKKFLSLVLPTAGNKAIVSIKDGHPRHYWFSPQQIDAAADKALELANSGFDTYYALSGFAGQERKADQVVAVKALWLDIDCGEDKDYPTRRDAALALQQFLNITELPTPLIVTSGYGLHCYWIFQRDLQLPEWKALAGKLKALCRQHGLRTDSKCTSDAARILRPIGTLNYKNGAPRRVRVVNTNPIQLNEAKVREVLGISEDDIFAALAKHMPEGSEAQDAFDEPTADYDQILSKCATLRWADEHQDQVREPLWYDILGVAGYCFDGEIAAHRASNKHPDYDRERTDRKLAQRRKAAGPTTCERFRTADGSKCNGCPHTVTTPLALGYPKTGITVKKVNALTSRQFTHQDLRLIPRQLQIRMPAGKPDNNGVQAWDWIKLSVHGIRPLLELRLLDSSGTASNYVWMETHDDKMQPKSHFVVPSQGITNSMQFATDCSKQGYYLEAETFPAAYRRFHKIMRTWVEEMKAAQGSVVTFRSFGWTGPDIADAKKDSFLLGTLLYNKDGTHAAPIIPALATYQYDIRSQGSLEEWTRAMNYYNDVPGMEGYMYLSWIAWGSPLMCFTNNGSIICHILGDTGVGKTSLQRAILSTYGDYNSKQLLDVNTSTLNSVGKTMGLFNSLPYCKEEATDADVQELASWALTVSQGREKGRMNQNMGVSPASTWSTIGCTSGNLSLRERVATARQDNAARLARIWEQELSLPIDQAEASRLFNPLRHNYGVAGPVYIRHLVDNFDDVQQRVIKMEEQLSTKLKAQGPDRFNIGLLAAIFTGAQIANELGLIHHDLKRGMQYAVQQYQRLKRAALGEKKSPEQNLARFIQEVQPTTLVVEYDDPANASTVFESDNNVVRNVALSNPITMRFAVRNSYFYAGIAIMRKWFADNHINFETDLKALELAGILINRDKRMVLTKGTKLSDRKQSWCMVFDLSKSPDLIDAPLVETK